MYITFFAKKAVILYNNTMLRKSNLSGSWYPHRAEDIINKIKNWSVEIKAESGLSAAVVPHAGWFYSGKTAAEAVIRICPGKELIVVVGGHLPPGSSILAASEDKIETPLGIIRNRTDLIQELARDLAVSDDIFNDNTVEVVIPMIKAAAPDADIIWLRAPADEKSIMLGEKLFELCKKKNIRAGVIGSTDLTHYGPNYGFTPHGRGHDAVDWVKTKNDAELIELLINMNLTAAINHAVNNKSACSIGAAAAAVRFAQLNNAGQGRLVDYTTSFDQSPAESFVGYAGIVF